VTRRNLPKTYFEKLSECFPAGKRAIQNGGAVELQQSPSKIGKEATTSSHRRASCSPQQPSSLKVVDVFASIGRVCSAVRTSVTVWRRACHYQRNARTHRSPYTLPTQPPHTPPC